MGFFKSFFTALFLIILFPCLMFLTCGIIINTTILDSNFMIAALSSIDITFILEEIMEDQFPGEIPAEVQKEFTGKVKALLDSQLPAIVTPVYDYMLGKSEKLDAVLELGEMKRELKPLILDYILESQPEKYHSRIKKEFNNYWKEISKEIPEQINLARLTKNTEAYETIESFKETIAYFQQIMTMLITGVIILFLLIILIHRNMITILRISGILLLLLSLIFIPLSTAADYIINLVEETGKVPQFAYNTIVSLISAVTNNIRLIGICYLITGGICIAGSIMLKKSNSGETEQENEMGNTPGENHQEDNGYYQ